MYTPPPPATLPLSICQGGSREESKPHRGSCTGTDHPLPLLPSLSPFVREALN